MNLLRYGSSSGIGRRRRRLPLLFLTAATLLTPSHGWTEDVSKTRIFMPYRETGYRTVPLAWEELVHIIEVDKDLKLLSRSVEQEKDYQIYMRDLRQEWKSVYDHVLCSKFQLEQKKDAADGKFYAFPPVAEMEGIRKCVVRNDFPYYLDEGIEHWILWKLGGDCTEEDIDTAREEIRQTANKHDFLHWINPPHLKSLPDIDHVHFLCK